MFFKIICLFFVVFANLSLLPVYANEFNNKLNLKSNEHIRSYLFQNKEGLIITEINTNADITIKPFVSEKLITNKEVYDLLSPLLVVNAGFFDGANGKTVSYIVQNGKTIATPEDNENLYTNPILSKHMSKILNRSEFRVLKKGNKIKYDITFHHQLPQNGWEILHSIQAGPMLLPKETLEEEFFVTYDKNNNLTRDAISATRKSARTAIGLRGDKVVIIVATRENPLTIDELSQICKQLKLKKAMGFDGGGSTSLDTKDIHITSEKDGSARRVKSFLVVDRK